ncbi:hypothetical protein PPL_07724 [Heterostelium album PN500]|uniref:very-long-chain (3R)-3-hydroxyacyl-CoA dehydratase n=1 Tax=Heterostelium pallidum (strain ATCC 26659 / Pp 5 / PN500) TaxID=670386 RepID=D3BGS2_HETP5|nr:hypothetical protein PPL_07724 [Heterostelium album PN500]EFA79306.1 hypothetical protein PPL_07724 [Heterostelium album PN500]|eukprot:XP_020431427.1 hypothetical protein PPL_07724 [Heterostelium album PN500]
MNLSKIYLITYNLIQFAGWSYILLLLVQHAHQANWSSAAFEGVWEKVGTLVTYFQFAACNEVLHSVFGLVRTPASTTFVQVFSRVACVTLALFVPTIHNTWVLTLMLFSWSITEVIRYLFYALSLIDSVPYVLGWLRYTLFIVLYPSGVTGETGTIIYSLPYVEEKQLFYMTMPNSINFSFNTKYVLIGSLIFYVVGLPWLYTYMLGQRKRFIQTGGGKQQSSSSTQKKTQ